jgi:membrane protein
MLVPTLLPGTDEAEQERLGDAQGAVFKERYLDTVKPFPGARDLLYRVHDAGKKVVLASSASSGELEHYVGLLGVQDILAATTSADDVEHTKPAPDIFAAALAKVAPLGSDEVIVVGDTPYDVEAAGKCGIKTIGLRSGGFSDDVLNAAGAIMLYNDAADLLAQFDSSPLAG